MTIPLTIRDAARAMRAGEITSVELTKALLERADRLDPILGVNITRMDATALAAAERADAAFAIGLDRGVLQGIPLGLKDILATDDAPTTANSLTLDPEWGKQGDGPAVRRLRNAGAIIISKNVTNEFASGGPDSEKPFPIPRNPWNPEHSPGGSSSGTGAGVAAGMFLGGLGTDTSGSVRWPAAANGVSGLMGTFGIVPKSGCTYNGYSLDHIGPLARSAWDCAALMSTIAGYDASDPNSVDVPIPDYTSYLDGNLSGLRVGVIHDGFTNLPDCSPEMVAGFEAAIDVFRQGGALISEVKIQNLPAIVNAQWVNNSGEKSGIYVKRYEAMWKDWGRFTRVGMSSFGLFLSASDFMQSLRVRTYAKKQLDAIMQNYDVILTPTMKAPAGKIADQGYASNIAMPILTSLWSFIGYPAIAIPMGFASNGLPLSLQISAKPFDETNVLKAADAYQQVTDFHLQVPPIVTRAQVPA